jgi:ribosomal protein S18 acetylase RimI-like enzyme
MVWDQILQYSHCIMKAKFITPEETYSLRHSVLRPHQDIIDCHYPGDHTGTTFHLGVFDNDKIISIGSYYREVNTEFPQADQYRLRGMATHPDYRKKGYGAILMAEGDKILKDRSISRIWCYAREVAFHFYSKVGFTFHGPIFDIPGIGAHKVMFKDL